MRNFQLDLRLFPHPRTALSSPRGYVRQEEASSPSTSTQASTAPSLGSFVAVSDGELETIVDFVQFCVDQSPVDQAPAQQHFSVSRNDAMSTVRLACGFRQPIWSTKSHSTARHRTVLRGHLAFLGSERLLRKSLRDIRSFAQNDVASGEPIQSVLPDSRFRLQILSGNKKSDIEREFLADRRLHISSRSWRLIHCFNCLTRTPGAYHHISIPSHNYGWSELANYVE